MTPMIGLWASVLGLLLLVLAGLLIPLLRASAREHACDRPGTCASGSDTSTGPRQPAAGRSVDEDEDEDERRRAVFAAARAELAQQAGDGALTPTDRAEAEAELALRLDEELTRPPAPRRRLSRRWTGAGVAAVLSLGLPVAALALYLEVGDPRAAAVALNGVDPGHATEGADVQGMVERLAARLRSQPRDLEGWMVLGRSLEVMARYGEANDAYERAIALADGPDQALLRARLHADRADALASARDGALDGPVQSALDASLALDPEQPKALALAGTAALRRGDTAVAADHWRRLLGLVEPESEMARRIAADLSQLEGTGTGTGTGMGAVASTASISGTTTPVPASRSLAQQGRSGTAGAANKPAATTAAATAAVLEGLVAISPAMLERARPGATLFVVVRAAGEPGPPLAAKRLVVGQWPLRFSIDDSDAMTPQRLPSSAERLLVEARVSLSGGANRQSGDPISAPVETRPGAQDLMLTIDRLVP